MSQIKIKEVGELEVYSMTDQPETCRKCDSRTDFIEIDETKQQHQCLSESCKYEYFVEEDYEE